MNYCDRMRKLGPIVIVLIVVLVVGTIIAINAHHADTGYPRRLSGQSRIHQKLPDIALPPVTTTTVAPAATMPTPTTVKPVIQVAPTTVPPIRTSGQTTIVTPTPTTAQTSTTPTTGVTAPVSNVTVQIWTTGVRTGPDGTACSPGPNTECVMLTSNIGANVVFPVYNNDVLAGTFAPKFQLSNGATCMILLGIASDRDFLSSSDCSGGAIVIMEPIVNLTYSVSPA